MIGPMIGHVPCALDHQRRLRQAAVERRAAWVRRRRRGRTAADPPAPGGAGEDVWRALRF